MYLDFFFIEFKQFVIIFMVVIFNIDIFYNVYSLCVSRVYEDNVLIIDFGMWLYRNWKKFGDD